MGDVAMLQVGVRRLQRLWPAAQIEVLTESPADLALFCPGAKSLPRPGRDLWIGDNAILGGFNRLLPQSCVCWFERFGKILPAQISRHL